MESKPTLKTPTEQGEKFENNFNKEMNVHNVNLNEVDIALNEKEQSLKKRIFDLSKMEALVHSDEKLSAIYNEMSQEGEEMYGYHYNETIMNMIFNDHVLNDPIYLQKYKNAIPKKKKRRDKSGIHQLQTAGEKEMEKDSNIDETTSAGGSAGAVDGSSRADGYSYVGPFGGDRDKGLDKPAWNGGVVVEENYLINPSVFKNYINESYSKPVNKIKSDLNGSEIQSLEFEGVVYVENGIPYRDGEKLNLSDDDWQMLWNEYLENNGIYVRGDRIYEKAESKAQQRFMGMVRGVQKGEIDSDKVSGDVLKAADEMKPSDVKDLASTKHDKLPEKVNEETYNRLRKIEYYDKLGQLQTVDDLENGTIPEEKLSTITDKPILITFDDDTTERITYDEFNKLYSHNEELPMNVKDSQQPQPQLGEDSIIDGNVNSMKLQPPKGDIAISPMGGIGESSTTMESDPQYVEYYKQYSDETPFLHRGDKYQYVWAKYPNGKTDIGVYSFRGDITYGYFWFRKNILGINENINEDGHCRKDEIPVAGKQEGEKGACKKKYKSTHIDPEEKKRSPHNIKQREKRIKDYEKRKDQKIMKENEFTTYETELKEMKDALETMNEDKRHSSLVNLDRLKKENNKNFTTEFNDSNTDNLIDNIGDKHVDLVTDIENPQQLSQDIEKEKLAQHKGNSFENVGNSTNDNNKEIPKRNITTNEQDDINMMRQGMQDIVYDNKPSERFEERMKQDIGDELYKERQDKLDYKSKAPMYNKDTQPVDDGEDVTQFDKNKSKYNTNKGIDESFTFTGKYRDELNKVRFINFKLSETIKLDEEKSNLFEISLDGLGNRYTQKVAENKSFNELSENKLYTDGKMIYLKKNVNNLNESVSKNNEFKLGNFEKMKNMINYNPSKFVDVKSTKKYRGF